MSVWSSPGAFGILVGACACEEPFVGEEVLDLLMGDGVLNNLSRLLNLDLSFTDVALALAIPWPLLPVTNAEFEMPPPIALAFEILLRLAFGRLGSSLYPDGPLTEVVLDRFNCGIDSKSGSYDAMILGDPIGETMGEAGTDMASSKVGGEACHSKEIVVYA